MKWMTRRSFLAASAMLTGSVAFGVATRQSDEDWLWMEGKPPEGLTDDGNYCVEGFRTIRYGVTNIIVPNNDDFRQRWIKAHRHCMVERPRAKSRRIRIFRHYLYGEDLH